MAIIATHTRNGARELARKMFPDGTTADMTSTGLEGVVAAAVAAVESAESEFLRGLSANMATRTRLVKLRALQAALEAIIAQEGG